MAGKSIFKARSQTPLDMRSSRRHVFHAETHDLMMFERLESSYDLNDLALSYQGFATDRGLVKFQTASAAWCGVIEPIATPDETPVFLHSQCPAEHRHWQPRAQLQIKFRLGSRFFSRRRPEPRRREATLPRCSQPSNPFDMSSDNVFESSSGPCSRRASYHPTAASVAPEAPPAAPTPNPSSTISIKSNPPSSNSITGSTV